MQVNQFRNLVEDVQKKSMLDFYFIQVSVNKIFSINSFKLDKRPPAVTQEDFYYQMIVWLSPHRRGLAGQANAWHGSRA